MESKWSFQNGQSPPTTHSKTNDTFKQPTGWKTPHGRARGLGKLDRITGQEPHLWEANTCVKWSSSNTAGANFGCHFLEKRNVFITIKGIFSDLPIYPIPKMSTKNIAKTYWPSWRKVEPAVVRKPEVRGPRQVMAPAWGLGRWVWHRGLERSPRRSQTNPPVGAVRRKGGIGGFASQNWLHYQETTSTPTSWRTRAASGCWINFRNSLGRFGIISYESSDDSMSCSKFKFFRIRYRNNILGTSKNFGLQFDTRERSSNVCSPAAHWVRSLSRDLKCKTASIAFWCLYHLYL